jgi:hypothetical protein
VANEPWQRRRREPVQRLAHDADRESDTDTDTPARRLDPSTTVPAAVQRTKGDRRALKEADLPLLQGAVGNRAMAGLLIPSLAVQRHSVRDAPPKPRVEELDDDPTAVQSLAVQSLAETPTVQRWDKTAPTVPGGKAPLMGVNRPPKPPPKPWARGTGAAPGIAPKMKIGARIPVLGAVAFTKPQLDADGVSTGKALVPAAPSRKVAWTIEGDAAGAVIGPDGTITAGNDLKGKESAVVDVKAADVLSPGAQAVGKFELWQPGLIDAKKDLNLFLAQGPYNHKDFMTANSFGKFDASYDPTARLLSIGMRLKFVYPDDKNTVFTSKKQRAARETRHNAYRDDFIAQVTTAWSGKFAFQNIREPKSVWARLNPVQVAVNVTPTTKNDEHFLLRAKMKTKGTANVSPDQVTTMFQGTDKKAENFTVEARAGELEKVKKAAPPVFFKPNTADLTDASLPTVEFLASYLRRLNTPKFELGVVGHGTDAKQATERALALQQALAAAGLGAPHVLRPGMVVDNAATPKGTFAPTVDPGYKNQQDVTAHEFGHMLGLDDEYEVRGNKGQGIETYDRVKDALGTDYADLTAKAGIDSESVMDGGSDVRIQHYITMWDLLGQLTTKKAATPTPKFGDADWKFIG